MKLTGYIFKLFLPLLLGALVLFCLAFEIVDLFMNMWKYLSNNVPVPVILKILYLYLPKTITFSLPLAILFATCYMLCILSSQNELVAMFASGISYIKAMLPLIIFSLLLSVGYFFFEDKIVVPFYKQYQELKNSSLNIEFDQNNSNVVIRSHDGQIIYKADVYEDENKQLNNVLLIVRNDDKKLNCIVKANIGLWNEEQRRWILSGTVTYKLDENGDLRYSMLNSEIEMMFDEPPETFRNNLVDVETVTVKEGKEYIEYLRRTGLPSSEALSVYYKKYSFPLVIFIVTLLAIGLSGRSRRNVIIISMILSVGASVLFYVLQMVTMLLAKFGFVTPVAGAWFPVIVFFIISLILLRYSKT